MYRTYGRQTNGLFCTSAEMNFIVGQRKPYYLVRMIPFDCNWTEPATTMAFPASIMSKVCDEPALIAAMPRYASPEDGVLPDASQKE